MRSLALLVAPAVFACGTDVASDDSPETGVDAGVIVAPDGRIIITPPVDAAPPDAIVELTECEEATRRSDLAWIQEHVFTTSCALAGCHTGVNPDVGLALDPPRTYSNLVNRRASTVAGWTRVVPGSPATSYLVVALGRADGPPPRDGIMPLGAPALCVEKLEAVERWIAGGAQP